VSFAGPPVAGGGLAGSGGLGGSLGGGLGEGLGGLGGSLGGGLGSSGALGAGGGPLSSLADLGGGPPPLQGSAPGVLGGGPGSVKLPTLNLLGGAMQQDGVAGGDQTPYKIQQLQASAIKDLKVDALCPGKQRQARDVGKECWAMIWTNGGCKAQNVPEYEQWHQTQSLEVLVADVVQWANLPDERHKQGCYGDSGPPRNEPAPPSMAAGSGMGGGLSPGLGGMGSGGLGGIGAAGGVGGGGPLGLGGGMGVPMQPQGPPPQPEVLQKIQSSLESPDLANLCPGLTRQSTSVGEACWKKIWVHVGCLEATTPSYEQWHNTQSLEILVADAAQWASLPTERHRKTCYGGNSEL